MKKVLGILLIGVLCFTGCGGITLTEKEQGMIAEYAASVLLQYSTSYQGKYQAQIKEEETDPMITEASTEPDEYVKEGNPSVGTKEPISEAAQEPLAAAMGLVGFDVAYTGYEIVSSYPDGEEIFIMKANSGQVLLILKFQIINTGSEEMMCDTLSNQLGFRLRINDEKRVNAQLTMLLNDLYAYKDSILPEEPKEAVLVFQIPEGEAGEINTLDLSVQYNGTNRLYPLTNIEE